MSFSFLSLFLPFSGVYVWMLQRIMQEIQQIHKIPIAVPSDEDEIVREFPVWIKNAASKGKLILLIDGFGKLKDSKGKGKEEEEERKKERRQRKSSFTLSLSLSLSF
jgi:hypothetical protein